MNPYQEARARLAQAIEAAYEAQRAHSETGRILAEADAQVDEARRVAGRWAVDPEYRGSRREQVPA